MKVKYVKWIAAVLVLVALAGWAYSKWIPFSKIPPLQLIPSDAVYIFETNEPLKSWETFSSSEFWLFMKKHPDLEAITADADYLDSLINAQRSLLKHFGDHHLILSAHMLGEHDYDFLFAFDLKESSRLKLSRLPLQRILGKESFEIGQQDYRGKEITEVKDREDGSTLYMCQVDNYLLCSYQLPFIHSSLNLQDRPELQNHVGFQLAAQHVGNKGLGQLYLNYSKLDELLGIYLGPNELLDQVGRQLSYSAWDLDLQRKELEVKGYTSIESDQADYVRLLQTYGNAKPSYHKVLSNRVAAVQSFHLNDIQGFYQSLLQFRENNAQDLQNYTRLKAKVEGLLKLSLEEDLMSWMGDELFIAQLSSGGQVAGIKAKNKREAEKKWAHIQRQIKRRTPAKFKELEYQGQSIYYLDLNGWFNLFFGKRFKQMDRPYYTFIGDYMFFSTDPEELKLCIDDYKHNDLLQNDDLYMRGLSQLDGKACLLSFARGPASYDVLQSMSSSSIEENKAYISYFKQVFLAYKSEDQGFSNSMHITFEP